MDKEIKINTLTQTEIDQAMNKLIISRDFSSEEFSVLSKIWALAWVMAGELASRMEKEAGK